MRKIYLFDLGLLVVAGALAVTLTNKPVTSDDPDDQGASVAPGIRDVRIDAQQSQQSLEVTLAEPANAPETVP